MIKQIDGCRTGGPITKHCLKQSNYQSLLKSVTSKIKRTTMSIAFIEKALYYEVTPTFAKVKGQFINLKDQRSTEKKVLLSHLKDQRFRLRRLLEEHLASTEALRNILNSRFLEIICFKVLAALRQEKTKQVICENKRLFSLKIKFNKLTKDKYNIPALNLSSASLDLSSLKYGLHQSFVDKRKYVKPNVAVDMESVALRLDNYVDVSMKETFHECLRSYTNIISNNVYSEKDNTVKLFSPLIKNDKIVIQAADEESCTVILNKSE